jgi:hypothetical protein
MRYKNLLWEEILPHADAIMTWTHTRLRSCFPWVYAVCTRIRLDLTPPQPRVESAVTTPLDQVSNGALRVKRHRERRAAGRLSLNIEVEEVALLEVLAQARLLNPLQDHGRDDLGHAVEQLLELLARDL